MQKEEQHWKTKHTAVVVAKRGPIVAEPDGALLICSETSDYRRVAQSLTRREGEGAVEIGCSYGVCSKILARRGWRVTCIDVAKEPLAHARERCGDGVELHLLDFCRDPSGFWSLLSRCRERAPSSVLFVDIGGEGLLKRVEELLSSAAVAHLAPRVIVIKNRALWKAASTAAGADAASVSEAGSYDTCGEFDNCRYRRVAEARAAAKAAGDLGYAFDHEPRLAPGSTSVHICRFHNFYAAGCTRSVCEYDHMHCYLCGQLGHRAIDRACVGAVT